MKHRILKLSAVLLMCGSVGLSGVYAENEEAKIGATPVMIVDDDDWGSFDKGTIQHSRHINTRRPMHKIIEEDFDDGNEEYFWIYNEGVQFKPWRQPGDFGRAGLQVEIDDD